MRYWIALAIIVVSAALAYAFSEQATISYNEPSMLTDGAPITDMTHTTVFVIYVGFDGSETVRPDIVIPASSPMGGSLIQYPVSFDSIDQIEWIRLWAIASGGGDPARNSAPSDTYLHLVDRVAPSAPK